MLASSGFSFIECKGKLWRKYETQNHNGMVLHPLFKGYSVQFFLFFLFYF